MAIDFKEPLPQEQQQTTEHKQKRLPSGWGTAAGPVLALVLLLCTEWVHRGALHTEFWTQNFFPHFSSYLLAWLFLTVVYYLIY